MDGCFRGLQFPDIVGDLEQGKQQALVFAGDWACARPCPDGDRCVLANAPEQVQAAIQQAQALVEIHTFIQEGGQQIQDDDGRTVHGQLCQHGEHLVAGEGPREPHPFESSLNLVGVCPQGAGQGVSIKAIAAIDDGHLPAQRQGRQHGHQASHDGTRGDH